MSGNSAIEWTEHTWNPVVGCSLKSPGCTHCYAMAMAARIEAINAARPGHETAPHYAGTTKKMNGTAVWTGKIALASDEVLLQPLRRKKPTVYFVNSMGDLFHEDCPDEWIDRVFAVMALCPQHTFQVLTKRAARMRDYCSGKDRFASIHHTAREVQRHGIARNQDQWPLPNVWLGVSTERQPEADERIPELLATAAAIRFISYEPALGPINLNGILVPDHSAGKYAGHGYKFSALQREDDLKLFNAPAHLDWVIAGGESGPKARPMHPDWARSLRDQCEAAGVKFFFKQWGEFAPYDRGQVDTRKLEMPKSLDGPIQRFGKNLAGRLLDGREHNAMPTRWSAS